MKFNKIFIPEAIAKAKGIEEIDISRLSNVIALVGKNGSGKSRILDLLEENLFKGIKVDSIFNGRIGGLSDDLEEMRTENPELCKYYELAAEHEELQRKHAASHKNERRAIAKQLSSLDRRLKSLNLGSPDNHEILSSARAIFGEVSPTLKQKYFRRIRTEEILSLRSAVEEAENDLGTNFEELIKSVEADFAYNELTSIKNNSLKYFGELPNMLAYDKDDAYGQSRKYKSMPSFQQFASLKRYINLFLGKNLTWEKRQVQRTKSIDGFQALIQGIWKIEGRSFEYSEFSEGEKILFAYALLFFLLDQNPNLNLKESVILIDEPELHLHPDSEIDVINGIRSAIGENGQLIFATHSLNILSTLNYEEIFMVKNGKVKHPTKDTPGESLEQLMSIGERVEKLTDFLDSVSTWTYVNFVTQCFEHPEVIQSAGRKDPQIEAFKKAIADNSQGDNCLLLDFGAGKGRVYEQLKDDEEFLSKITYQALEPDVEHHALLSSLGADKIYDHYSKLEEKTFDFVLLCNVLHEIEIGEWEQCLKNVVASLKHTGFLVVIETKTLSKGEKIGKTGFVLLDSLELKKLFGLSSEPALINIGPNREKIICALIRKSRIKEISKKTVFETLKLLEINTLKKIKALRDTDQITPNYELGRKLAFLSQQHINARLGQDEVL